MLSKQQIEAFREKGLLKLKSFLPSRRIAPAREEMLRRAAARGLWQGGKWQYAHLPPSPVPPGVSKLLGRMQGEDVFGDMINAELKAGINQLVAGQLTVSPRKNGQVLFTLPHAEQWTLPATAWHLDVSRLPGFELPGVQVFTFLGRVVPQGGGTLVVTGSHRLLNENQRISSKQVRKRLAKWPYFRDLMDEKLADRRQLLKQTVIVEGVELQVVEMHGEPGDVYLMDMRLLHTLAPNAATIPRMMWTQRFFIREAYREMYGKLP